MGRAVMFGWMADEVKARNPDGSKTLVAIMDGQESLWNELDTFQGSTSRVEILDLLHVTPRIWTAARIFCSGEKQVRSYVRTRLLSILQGDVDGVIRGLKRTATLRNLHGTSRKTIARICAFLHKNRSRMQYHEYLTEGYPIAVSVAS